MKYHLYREQQLRSDMETVWRFFSSPINLSKITPANMRFTVLSKCDSETIFEGMIIDYRVAPVLGILLRWQTKITQVDQPGSFTDFQQMGPYKYWKHFHEFTPNQNGVLMKDRVDYELPFGIFGKIAHWAFVKRRLESIFNFRHEVLEKLFNR